jgi:hypothetical protein
MDKKETKENDDLVLFEKKIKIATNYILFISFMITSIIFFVIFLIEFFNDFYGGFFRSFGWVLGLYILLILTFIIMRKTKWKKN